MDNDDIIETLFDVEKKLGKVSKVSKLDPDWGDLQELYYSLVKVLDVLSTISEMYQPHAREFGRVPDAASKLDEAYLLHDKILKLLNP